jgi:hypothetical protein
MELSVKSGSAMAAVAASLLLSGAVVSPSTQAVAADVGHCVGANACKGQSACKGASNACKGQNACKGKGFLEMTKADCEKIEGANYIDATPKG